MFYWKDRMEGRKEINNLNFHYFFFHLLYSFTKRRYTAGRRVVDRCLEQVRKQRCALDTYNWFTFVVFHLAEDSRLSWCFIEHDFFSRSVILRIDKYPKNQFMFTVPGRFLFFSIIIIYIYIYIERERERGLSKKITI